jgi:ABC-type polysaccharide/polyol phosphate export permease
MNKAIKDLVAGAKLYQVWLFQAYHELSVKFKRTALGSLWIAGNFLFVSVAITLVWGQLFNRDLKEMLPHAMLGNLCATLSLWIVSDAPELFMSSSAVIRNHAYPFTYYAFEKIARNMMQFAHNLVIFYIFMVFMGTFTIPNPIFFAGLAIDLVSLFTWGMVVGMLAARFRDIRFLLPSLTFLLYFLTPVYWHVEMLSPSKRWIADVNPINGMMSVLREPLLGHFPSDANWMGALAVCVSGIIVWGITFPIFRRRIPFWV